MFRAYTALLVKVLYNIHNGDLANPVRLLARAHVGVWQHLVWFPLVT